MILTALATLGLVSGLASNQQTTRAPGVPREVPGGQAELAAPTVFEGIVLTIEGRPVPDALVITSAGGRTRTAGDGSFRIEVELVLPTEEVELCVARGPDCGSAVLGAIRPAP